MEATMKSLTLHALDDQLAERIKQKSNQLSISMNELAKRILAEGLGIKVPATPPHRADFATFCGTWSQADTRDFAQRTADMGQVQPEDWQ
jgi:hypothetical protein